MTEWVLRPAEPSEIGAIARLWHAGWHDGHAGVVPDTLTAIRTLEDFEARLPELIKDTLAAGPFGAPVGFCVTLAQELYQFYVAPEARGTGFAARLLAAGEARISAAGHDIAQLDVAIGNDRAERFYSKCGWQAQGPLEVAVKTANKPFKLTLLRMTKTLNRTP